MYSFPNRKYTNLFLCIFWDQSAAEAQNRPAQVSHGVVMGTFNVQDNGDGGLADVNRVRREFLFDL